MDKDTTVISANSEIWNNNLWSYNARFQTVCTTPVTLSLQEYNWHWNVLHSFLVKKKKFQQ